jgi:hypothetical protein
MSNVSLREVFGISTDVPKYTYVDRQNLDKLFGYYLESQKHIVVHGASKQGKSCLRKKTIDDKNSLIIQCLPSMETMEDVWRTALERAGVEKPVSSSVTSSSGGHIDAEVTGQAKLPFLGGIEATVKGGIEDKKSLTKEKESIHGDSLLLKLAIFLRENNKRLILEDFHYLPDDVRKNIASGLKALYEEKAYIIIIGIWSEQNLITYYNGDLTGRIEEINLTWDQDELAQVLSKGEGALNIEFAPGFKSQLIESTFGNVGLVQRLAEAICLDNGILQSSRNKQIISDIELLKKARRKLVTDIRQRYSRITEVFKDGMRSDAVLLLYARIYNALLDSTDEELISGISYESLFERIQKEAGRITVRQSDLTSALDKVERLQARKGVTPLLVSYSKDLRKLFLNDREFMFYRKFSGDNISDLKISIDDTVE